MAVTKQHSQSATIKRRAATRRAVEAEAVRARLNAHSYVRRILLVDRELTHLAKALKPNLDVIQLAHDKDCSTEATKKAIAKEVSRLSAIQQTATVRMKALTKSADLNFKLLNKIVGDQGTLRLEGDLLQNGRAHV